MNNKAAVNIAGTIMLACSLFFTLVVLSSCGATPGANSNATPIAVASAPSTAIFTPSTEIFTPSTATAPVPPPVGTRPGPFITMTPLPYATLPPAPTLPGPPRATSFPVVTQPVATPPPATQTVHSSAKGASLLSNANIAWGNQTKDSLTIWVGTYNDSPTPSITGARAVAKWATPLVLVDLAFSPDNQSLAVLSIDNIPAETEGIWPGWLSVIDLTTNNVQNVPDYNSHYDLYDYSYYRAPEQILGWLDNSRFVVGRSGGKPVVATKDGASYSEVSYQQSGGVDYVALSPDRTTFFSAILAQDIGLWLNNTDGSNPRQVLAQSSKNPFCCPVWSPDGRYISVMSPKSSTQPGDPDYRNIRILDLQSNTEKPVSGTNANVWDVAPAWSVDGTSLAFLRADTPPASRSDLWYGAPASIATNIFVASASDGVPQQLTRFNKTGNSSLVWTPGGSLVLSSTAGSATNLPGLIVVSKTGTVATLLGGLPGESLVHPTLITH